MPSFYTIRDKNNEEIMIDVDAITDEATRQNIINKSESLKKDKEPVGEAIEVQEEVIQEDASENTNLPQEQVEIVNEDIEAVTQREPARIPEAEGEQEPAEPVVAPEADKLEVDAAEGEVTGDVSKKTVEELKDLHAKKKEELEQYIASSGGAPNSFKVKEFKKEIAKLYDDLQKEEGLEAKKVDKVEGIDREIELEKEVIKKTDNPAAVKQGQEKIKKLETEKADLLKVDKPVVAKEEALEEDVPGTVREGGTVLEAAPKRWTDGRIIVAEDGFGRPLSLMNAAGEVEHVEWKGDPEKDDNGNVILAKDTEGRPTKIIDVDGEVTTVVQDTKPKSLAEQELDKLEIAQKEVVNAKIKQNEEFAKVREDFGEQWAKNQEEWKTKRSEQVDKINNAEAKLTELQDKLVSTKVDANRFWNNKDTGQKIGLMLGIAFGGVSPNPNHVNRALEGINKAIDRDIKAQQTDLLSLAKAGDLQSTLMGRLYQGLGSIDAASKTMQVFQQSNLLNDLEKISLKTSNPVLKAAVDSQIQEKRYALEVLKQTNLQKFLKDNAKIVQDARNRDSSKADTFSKEYNSNIGKLAIVDVEAGFDRVTDGLFRKDGVGDTNMIQALARMGDPGSVVREAEIKLWQDTYGWSQGKIQQMFKGVWDGTKLPDEVRWKLYSVAQQILKSKLRVVDSENKAYEKKINIYNKQNNGNINYGSVITKTRTFKDYKDKRINLIDIVKKRFPNLRNMPNNEVLEFIKETYPEIYKRS